MNASPLVQVLFTAFMVVVVVWRVWETFRKQGSERGRTSMHWSFYALFAVSCLVFGGTIVEFVFLPRPHSVGLIGVGIVLFVVSNVLRVAAIRALGRFWSLHIEIREQHQFVREGPYRHVRHPAYLAFILEHIAVPLAGSAWFSLGITLVLYVPMILWRIRCEDRALIEKFGDSYRRYRQEVGALVPKVASRSR